MECFAVNIDDLEGRLDCHYYKPEFIELEKKLSKLKGKSIKEISFDLKNGSTPAGGFFEKEGIPYFRSQDFKLFDFEINQYIKESFHKKLKRSSIEAGDVLLAVVGATLGVVGYVPDNIKEGNINQNVVRIRVKDKNVNSKYLSIVLSSQIGQKLILRNATITTQAYINNSQLESIIIPLPPLSTQNHVVQIMDNAYKIKEQKETEAQQLLDSINNYVLDELGIKFNEIKEDKIYCVSSENVENNRNDPYYYNPKFNKILNDLEKSRIKLKTLKEIATKIFNGKTPPKDDYSDGGNLILKVSCLRNNKIKWDNLSYFIDGVPAVKTIKNKDILLLSSAHQADYLGKNPCIIEIPENLKNNKIHFVGELISVRVNQEEIKPYYLLAILKLNEYYLLVNREKRGQSSHLYPDDLGTIKIPLPPFSVQNKIAEEVKRRMHKAERLQNEAKQLLQEAKEKVEKMILGE